MALISDSSQQEKLAKYKLNIKTKYIVGDEILERNTDNSHNDDITSGIRVQKEYYLNNKLIHTEKQFDSRIEYTFISQEEEDKDYTCPNCGLTAKIKTFIDGCPYCKTYYNVDYIDKELGSKHHYDQVLRSNLYRVITFIADLIISLILSYFFIKYTSRTFNSYDISKVLIYGVVLALILYYLFYILDAYIVLTPIKKYKDKQNEKQIEFWNRTGIDKKNFFNNLNYEIRNYYYKETNIIDYDVIDYLSFQEFERKGQLHVAVKLESRLVYFKNNKIKSKYVIKTYILRQDKADTLHLDKGANIITCHNCGASISAIAEECDYCHTKTKHLQEWHLIK